MERLIDHANVVIRMKGLGILHYNGAIKKWESILLRGIFKHELKITVTKIDFDGKPIGAVEEHPVPPEVKKIEVITNNSKSPGHIFTSVDFQYHPGKDGLMDAGWILDISKELYKKAVKLSKKTRKGRTLLTVDHATLYTGSMHDTTKPYLMVDSGLNSLPNTPPFVNPRAMADFVGMDILWDSANPSTVFMFDGEPAFPPLVKNKDIERYEVLIDNNCPENDCRLTTGDFTLYHTHLIDMDEEFFEIPPPLAKLLQKTEKKFSFNVRKFKDLDHPDVIAFTEAIKDVVLLYGGKTNDCGFLMCSELDPSMNDTLEGLIP